MTQQRKTVKIEPGSRVQLRVAAQTLMAAVEQAVNRRELHVHLAEAVSGHVVVRFLDEDGDAWRTTANATPQNGLVVLRLDEDWQIDVMRASQRITGERHSLRGEVQAGSLPPGTRLDFVCLDLSASGCRTSGVGRQPKSGDLVRLALQHPWDEERWVLARAMRVAPLAFGRFEVGFRFEAEEPGERAWLTAWRDAWSYVALANADGVDPLADQAA
jgi:hypothetical protein